MSSISSVCVCVFIIIIIVDSQIWVHQMWCFLFCFRLSSIQTNVICKNKWIIFNAMWGKKTIDLISLFYIREELFFLFSLAPAHDFFRWEREREKGKFSHSFHCYTLQRMEENEFERYLRLLYGKSFIQTKQSNKQPSMWRRTRRKTLSVCYFPSLAFHFNPNYPLNSRDFSIKHISLQVLILFSHNSSSSFIDIFVHSISRILFLLHSWNNSYHYIHYWFTHFTLLSSTS